MRMVLVAFLLLFSALVVGLFVAGARIVRDNSSELAGLVTSWRFVATIVAVAAFTYSYNWEPWVSPTAMFLLLVPIAIARLAYARAAQEGTQGPSAERPPTGTRRARDQVAVPTGAELIARFRQRRMLFLSLFLSSSGYLGLYSWLTYRGGLGPSAGWALFLGGLAWLALASLLVAFYVYRCPACNHIPAIGLESPWSCRQCRRALR